MGRISKEAREAANKAREKVLAGGTPKRTRKKNTNTNTSNTVSPKAKWVADDYFAWVWFDGYHYYGAYHGQRVMADDGGWRRESCTIRWTDKQWVERLDKGLLSPKAWLTRKDKPAKQEKKDGTTRTSVDRAPTKGTAGHKPKSTKAIDKGKRTADSKARKQQSVPSTKRTRVVKVK